MEQPHPQHNKHHTYEKTPIVFLALLILPFIACTNKSNSTQTETTASIDSFKPAPPSETPWNDEVSKQVFEAYQTFLEPMCELDEAVFVKKDSDFKSEKHMDLFEAAERFWSTELNFYLKKIYELDNYIEADPWLQAQDHYFPSVYSAETLWKKDGKAHVRVLYHVYNFAPSDTIYTEMTEESGQWKIDDYLQIINGDTLSTKAEYLNYIKQAQEQ